MARNKFTSFFLFLFILINLSKNIDELEDEYYFQLYPSESKEKPYLFHVYTPDYRFITVNSTEGENCTIIENKTVKEYPIKELSSVILFNKTLLIKTCFGPNTIVEIINEKNETFSYKKNNADGGSQIFDKVKFCYSTAIYNPLNTNEYMIMTYWTEFKLENGVEKYTHKYVLFDPKKKQIDSELEVDKSFLIQYFTNNNYAKSCITFRATIIYCRINGDSGIPLVKHFYIDTSKLSTSDAKIHLVFSNSKNKEYLYENPIAIGKEIHDIFGGLYDSYLTEYHDEKENKIMLVSSLLRKSLRTSFIFVSDKTKKYYGINIEDSYIDQNLFNHLLPNKDDLIIIYIMKTINSMGLVMTRFNLTTSKEYHKSFKELSLSNYLREDICSKPKHIQSIFVNSFINYNDHDKDLMKKGNSESFYKYQKDIVTLLACEDKNKNVFYESKKIIMPQCLNVLDEINNKDYHYIKFKENTNYVTLDIYNDPNLLSLRNITIEFLPIYISGLPILIRVKTKETNYTLINYHNVKNKISNPTHIQIFRTNYFNTREVLSLPYRLIQTGGEGNSLKCHLSSDICKFEIIQKNDDECNIDYCIFCQNNTCKECKNITGISLDSDNKTCVCDIEKGFNIKPKTFYSNFDMCICEENYSFYKDISLCRPNIELTNGSYCVDTIDDVSLIPIYIDSPKDCIECVFIDGLKYCQNPNKTIIYITDPTDKIRDGRYIPGPGNICVNSANLTNLDNNTWFEYLDHRFYYAKIGECVYILYNESLFFYSDKKDCEFTETVNVDYISQCLNIFTFNSYDEYKQFLKDSKEYNPKDEKIVIYKEIDEFNFRLINSQKESNFSELEISEECEKYLKDFYQINKVLKLLTFKVDIIKENILLRQVEYAFYNPEPKQIYKKLDLHKCFPNDRRRRLELDKNNSLDSDEIFISIPLNLTQIQRERVKELYEKNILLFDSNEDFYNDVCHKYTTPNKADIYIEDRRENYFIFQKVCESECNATDYIIETDKIKCRCPIKFEPKLPENETRIDPFKEKVLAPNLQSMKCFKQGFGTVKNFGLFFILLLLIAYIASYYSRKKFITNKFKELTKQIKEKDTNLKIEDEDEEPDHLYKPNKNALLRKEESEEEQIKNDRKEEEEEEKKTKIRGIKNKKRKEDNEEDNNIEVNKMKINVQSKKEKSESDSETKSKNSKKRRKSKSRKKSKRRNNNDEKEDKNNEDEKEEEEEEKKSKKRRKSKKKLIVDDSDDEKDNENNDDNEDEKEEEKKSKKSKKSNKSKSKPKKNNKTLIVKEENEIDIESNIDTIKENKSEIEKVSDFSEGIKKKKEQQNEHYDTDKKSEKEKNKEELNINAIMDNSFIGNKNIKGKEEDKNDNDLIGRNDDDIDPDMEYNLDNLIDESKEEKSQNSINIKSNKKKKKKRGNPANPPKNSNGKNEKRNEESNSQKEHTSFFSDKKEIAIQVNDDIIQANKRDTLDSKEGFNESKSEKEKNPFINDYIIDNYSFQKSIKEDKRGFFMILLSVIKYNNTILYIILCDGNDFFAKFSASILSLCFYLFVNIILMYNLSGLHLYVGRDKSFNEKFNLNSFALNILIPSLIYIFTSYIKETISVREFIYDIMYEYGEIDKQIQNDNFEEKKIALKTHDLKTEISKNKNKILDNTEKLLRRGIIFIVLIWYVSICFCGLYENSASCLIINTLISILFTSIFTLAMFIFSAIFRFIGIKSKNESLFNISTFLNPSYRMYSKGNVEEEEEKEKKHKKNN